MPEAGVAPPRVRVERRGPAVRLTLSWPEKRNALSLAVLEELRERLLAASAEPATRALVLAGEGPAFSAGHYLPEVLEADPAGQRRLFESCARLMAALREAPQPVIAEVRGVATAAGCQLVAACDLAVAAETARFATPGVRIGLFCSTPMVPLTRAVGRKRAMEMLLTGEFVDAGAALDWGLVNRVVPESDLEATTQEFAEKIAAASPFVVGLGKRAFHAQVDLPVEEAVAAMSSVMCDNAVQPDAREGIRAFLGKRPPHWRQPAEPTTAEDGGEDAGEDAGREPPPEGYGAAALPGVGATKR